MPWQIQVGDGFRSVWIGPPWDAGTDLTRVQSLPASGLLRGSGDDVPTVALGQRFGPLQATDPQGRIWDVAEAICVAVQGADVTAVTVGPFALAGCRDGAADAAGQV